MGNDMKGFSSSKHEISLILCLSVCQYLTFMGRLIHTACGGSLKESVALQEGFSVGAVWAIYQTTKKLGIEKALGTTFSGKLALWQVVARVIDQ